ncbi:MAG: phosphate acyltransferase PlsX [Deltaproteobacteria bacterium]|nr:phosphate acyltransferase PlsX [Deltaproteobacteria bacterium]
MKIALDAMGGDFAPRENVEGALLAARRYGISVVLIGDEPTLRKELHKSRFTSQLIEIVHAAESIDMGEKSVQAVREKKQSSLHVGLDLLKKNEVQAFVSPGHTGALMTASALILKRLDQVERPAIAGLIPTLRGNTVVLDLGANVDCKPHHLVQFATMGSVYAHVIEGKTKPKVGLLCNGTEPTKGTELLRTTYQLIEKTNLNFVGFVESLDVFKGKVDVVVCDGFVGNVFLKTIEGMVSATSILIRQDIQRNMFSKALFGLFYMLFKSTLKNLGKKFDYSEYGAAPLLGVNGLVFVCHGKSSRKAIQNALIRARSSVEGHFLETLNREMLKVHVV